MLRHVKMVEVEIHSRCNRKCSWCPNKDIDRTSQVELPEKHYLKMLEELRSNGFAGTISYSRNNEPLSDPVLFRKRLEQAREILPHVRLVTNTNGDFLDLILPLNELSIMDYDCIGVIGCVNRLTKAGATITDIDQCYVYAEYGPMKIVYVADWPKYVKLEDRGGYFVEDYISQGNRFLTFRNERRPRTKPCSDPSIFIAIDYNGNVTPCCCIRSDLNIHQNYILGNIATQSLVDIFYSAKAAEFRQAIANTDISKFPPPCKHCQKGEGRYIRKNPGIKFREDYI